MKSSAFVFFWYLSILGIGRLIVDGCGLNSPGAYALGVSFAAVAIFMRVWCPGIKDEKPETK